jgi:DNA-binding MarR family transcriptional regulator
MRTGWLLIAMALTTSLSRIQAYINNLRATMFNPLRAFGFLIKDVSDRYMQRFEQRADALGLTLPLCRVLVGLANHEGISQAQLADLSDIDPMTLVRILDRMESNGWLERRNDPTDSRAQCLYSRAKSKPLVDDIWYLADLTRREAFAGIPSAQADIVIAMLEQRLRWPLMSFAAIAVLGGGAYFYIKGSRYQSTDDAYAQAASVSISANVGGRVSKYVRAVVQRHADTVQLFLALGGTSMHAPVAGASGQPGASWP